MRVANEAVEQRPRNRERRRVLAERIRISAGTTDSKEWTADRIEKRRYREIRAVDVRGNRRWRLQERIQSIATGGRMKGSRRIVARYYGGKVSRKGLVYLGGGGA